VWSERYDRELTTSSAIQDDIAQATSRALQLQLISKPARHTPNFSGLRSAAQSAASRSRTYLPGGAGPAGGRASDSPRKRAEPELEPFETDVIPAGFGCGRARLQLAGSRPGKFQLAMAVRPCQPRLIGPIQLCLQPSAGSRGHGGDASHRGTRPAERPMARRSDRLPVYAGRYEEALQEGPKALDMAERNSPASGPREAYLAWGESPKAVLRGARHRISRSTLWAPGFLRHRWSGLEKRNGQRRPAGNGGLAYSSRARLVPSAVLGARRGASSRRTRRTLSSSDTADGTRRGPREE